MACIITYNNKKYTQSEFNEYFKSHFFEFTGDFIGNKQDIEGFKKFVGKSTNLIDTIDPIQNIVNKINSNFTEEDLNNQLNNCKI